LRHSILWPLVEVDKPRREGGDVATAEKLVRAFDSRPSHFGLKSAAD
jgi:hypothetical protein